VSYIDELVAGGIPPLQCSDDRWPVQLRTIKMGCRITGQDSDGTYVMDRNSIGDQLGWNLWPQVAGARAIPAWAQAWPAAYPSVPSGSGTTTAQAGVLPLGSRFRFNGAFGLKQVRRPLIGNSNRRATPMPVGGEVGIVLSAVEDYLQDDLFLSTDQRLVAVNVRGNPACGTLVCDLNEDSGYDDTRFARLQTMMRVIPMGFPEGGIGGFVADPNNPPANLACIAWNLALTGQESALGRGLVIDQSSGAMYTPPPAPDVPTLDDGQGRPLPQPPIPPLPPLPPGAGGPPPPPAPGP